MSIFISKRSDLIIALSFQMEKKVGMMALRGDNVKMLMNDNMTVDEEICGEIGWQKDIDVVDYLR